MVHAKINFVCGCGFHTTEQAKAEGHADDKKHILYVSGEVRPDKTISVPKTAVRPVVPASVPMTSEIDKKLAAMKKKLQGG